MRNRRAAYRSQEVIILRARGGESIEEAVTRATALAASQGDEVTLFWDNTSVVVQPTWIATVVGLWRAKRNEELIAKGLLKP